MAKDPDLVNDLYLCTLRQHKRQTKLCVPWCQADIRVVLMIMMVRVQTLCLFIKNNLILCESLWTWNADMQKLVRTMKICLLKVHLCWLPMTKTLVLPASSASRAVGPTCTFSQASPKGFATVANITFQTCA